MWASDRPFRAARLSFIAIGLLLFGAILSLILSWARLGTQGQSWGLLQSCPVCVAAARFIGPIAAVDTASRVAAIMVWVALLLGLVGLAYFAQTRITSSFQTFLISAGGFVLAFSPVVFVMLLPEAVPIHLDVGGYLALFFGILALVTSTAAFRADSAESSLAIRDGWAKDDDEEEDLKSQRSEASAAATYGALGRT